jgi:hypothetical protein
LSSLASRRCPRLIYFLANNLLSRPEWFYKFSYKQGPVPVRHGSLSEFSVLPVSIGYLPFPITRPWLQTETLNAYYRPTSALDGRPAKDRNARRTCHSCQKFSATEFGQKRNLPVFPARSWTFLFLPFLRSVSSLNGDSMGLRVRGPAHRAGPRFLPSSTSVQCGVRA